MPVKRFFFLYGRKQYSRAKHAHKKCNQILIPINGSAKVSIKDKKGNMWDYHWKLPNKKRYLAAFNVPDYKYFQKKICVRYSLLPIKFLLEQNFSIGEKEKIINEYLIYEELRKSIQELNLEYIYL